MTHALEIVELLAPLATGNAVVGRDVVRRYGEGESAVEAVGGVSLEAPTGQFTAVMGPSGSGKSTLMHVLAGLDKPTSGTVEIGGRDVTGISDKELTLLRRDHVGFIFQFFNLAAGAVGGGEHPAAARDRRPQARPTRRRCPS